MVSLFNISRTRSDLCFNKKFESFHLCHRMSFLTEKVPTGKEETGDNYNEEERPADQKKGLHEFSSPSGVFTHVYPIIDNGRKRTDQRAKTSGIRAVDQTRKVLRKREEHNRRGNVGDQLTETDRPPVFATGDRSAEKSGNMRI